MFEQMFSQIDFFFTLNQLPCCFRGNIGECDLSSFNFKKQDFYYARISHFLTATLKLNSSTGL